MKVLLIGPVPPPYGGMALQARQLERLLRCDGVDVATFASNFALPFRPIERAPGLRTLVRAALIWFKLWPHVRRAEVLHILAASWLYFFMLVYPALLVGRACGKRVVINYRGGEAREFFRFFGWIAAPVFRLADVVTAPSEFLAGVIRQRFDVPVSIVPNILDNSRFRYRQRSDFRPRLLVTRHLEKPYDVESVLRAFRDIQERYPDASLWIAGTGSEEGHLRRLVSTWNLINVRFLGNVAHQDLAAIYDERDIYVNASIVDNFPGALVEASASGLVVVTTGAGGIPFVYENGRTALLVEPRDSQGLAAAVVQVLENPSLAAAMTKAALGVAHACDWIEVRSRLFEAYGFNADAIAARRAAVDEAGYVTS